jgi:hypothetical protein
LEKDYNSTEFVPICNRHELGDTIIATDVRCEDVRRISGV